ncbi:arsenosugar biosynthesis radical SAM (seleno)protein ArsS [Roseiconus lacunae]|uniref:Arsenosugar biosynthesis radical SAM protein ArsS n=1 Tax=Roseiconus lacunae TaxID=2605694 RepID=A0ABT7PIE2_9BACT|nr:arsenosugar biosynthesis radical SAM (seleno)protein ArsS [Roseiconus lacunae]MCD0458377.1 arsenosugar biosynthesis radical SAM protein ArsS [Roseiconus lacunae]MDM4016267.1 arsenosugar biosynthesis radical SAM protein ArsS [Roseiconus lacunae]
MKSLLPVIDAGRPTGLVRPFSQRVQKSGKPLVRETLRQLQINVGKLCNQTCVHCHVEAGPTKKRENMDAETVERIIELSRRSTSLELVDITGGAPEMNPHFKRLVQEFRSRGIRVIDRCNLTILSQPGYEWIPAFLVEHQVSVVASLPCYLEDNVNAQRGSGVFSASIDALRQLNELGYGSDPHLKLDLVYNPTGTGLPPDQSQLQRDYKRELAARYSIVFNELLTITNIPIKRFAMFLAKKNKLEDYLQTLEAKFNPAAADSVMCRSLLSVSWDGKVYDCDFNQMIDLPAQVAPPSDPHSTGRDSSSAPTVWTIDAFEDLTAQRINTADHCYGCTAGAGSGCGGALT